MHRTEIGIPEEPIVDLLTGYSINVPLGWQDYPGWQFDRPEIIDRIKMLRTQMGILIRDDYFEVPEFIDDGQFVNPVALQVQRRGVQSIVDQIMDMKRKYGGGVEKKGRRRPTVRHVRTPEGARRFGQPIGAVIIADKPMDNFRELTSSWEGYTRYRGADGYNYWVYEEAGKWYAVDDDNRIMNESSSEDELLSWIDDTAKSPFAKPYRGERDAPEGFHKASVDERTEKKVPPAWVDVFINDDKDAALIAVGYDGQDRKQSLYSAEHTKDQAAKKYEHVKAMKRYMPALDRALSEDWKTNDNAQALLLIRRLGMRPGSTSETRALEQAFGAITLEARHVRVNQDSITFDFTGKKGVRIHINTKDPEVVAMVRSVMRGKSRRDRLFPGVTPQSVGVYLKDKTTARTTLKDLRTYKANELALALIAKIRRKPKTETEFKRKRNEIADAVAAALGNTRTMALNSYINPTVFYAIAQDPLWLEKIINKGQKTDA